MTIAVLKWNTPGTITDLLTTELNNLANNAGSNLGTEYDNRTNQFLFGDFVATMVFAAAPTAGNSLDLYMICKTNGTTYEDGSSSVRPPNSYIGSFVLVATSALLSIRGVPLPDSAFKLTLFNGSGQAMAAAGSKITLVPYGYQSVS